MDHAILAIFAAAMGIIGAGGQARYQLEALLGVRQPKRVLVWSRTPARSETYAEEMRARSRSFSSITSSPMLRHRRKSLPRLRTRHRLWSIDLRRSRPIRR